MQSTAPDVVLRYKLHHMFNIRVHLGEGDSSGIEMELAAVPRLRERGVKFRSITEQIDTETPTGRMLWQMFGIIAEFERGLIVERTQAGLKAARRRGVKFGRKPKMTAAQLAKARKLIDGGERVEDVAALWNVGRSTLYRALS